MEAWQKGAPVVLKMSSSAKEKYFKKFPDRLEWFQRNHPEHFGHSVTQSTVTLKKATDAKVAAQKIADMRYKKALEASSERVKEMGTRRRESGEGLGGGLESNKDIVAYVRQHGSIKAGRLGGDLYEGKEMSHAKTLAEQIIARKAKELLEEPQSEADAGEYDYEGDMAKSQLRSILHNAKMLHDMLEDNTNLPEWVQSKITLAEDYILTAANYMRGELKEMDEEVELDEESKNLRFDPEAPLRMSAPIVKMWKRSKTGDKKAAAAWAKHVRRIQKVEPEGMSKKDIEDHMQSHFGESVEITEEEIATLSEAKMTAAQMKKREKIVKGMKPISDWESRYPGRGEKVMYATATKMAMKEEVDQVEEGVMDVLAGAGKGAAKTAKVFAKGIKADVQKGEFRKAVKGAALAPLAVAGGAALGGARGYRAGKLKDAKQNMKDAKQNMKEESDEINERFGLLGQLRAKITAANAAKGGTINAPTSGGGANIARGRAAVLGSSAGRGMAVK